MMSLVTGAVNLLILTSSFPLGRDDGRAAAGLFVADLARVLSSAGHQVDVATPGRSGTKEEWPGFAVHWVPWPGGDKALTEIKLLDPREWPGVAALCWSVPRRLERLCRARRVDATIAMWAVPAGWWARHVKRTLGIPFVTWCLGSDIWTFGQIPVLRSVVRAALAASDAIFADGIELAAMTERLCGRACAFLPSTRMLDQRLAGPVETAGRRPLFFFVGRYVPVKGGDILLEAMAEYVRRGGTGELVMRGGGPMEAELQARAARSDLRGRVRVGGFADPSVVVSYLAACDVQIIPSRMESIPVAYSDALQMGRPLIVSDVGDMGQLMRRHAAGLVVPPENPRALAEAMLAVDRDGMGNCAAAVARAACDFDLAKSADTLVSALRRAAHDGTETRHPA